jgi:hypothetical protein
VNYGKYVVDTVLTFHPVSRQIKTIIPAYHAADAAWEYYKAYREGGVEAVADTYVKDRLVKGLADLQTEAAWNAIGADKFVPAQYKQPARQILNNVMTKISEKEVDFVEEYLARKTSG